MTIDMFVGMGDDRERTDNSISRAIAAIAPNR
jgi:hypothetical protein